MTLTDEIAKLPEWPKWCGDTVKMTFPSDFAEWEMTCHALAAYGAALARLALAREWIETAHAHEHECQAHYWTDPEAVCTCGRDALLAALEVPK